MRMEFADIAECVRAVVAETPEIAFAYLHGSLFDGESPRDLDVAVYLHDDSFERLAAAGDVSMECAIPLEMRLESEMKLPADVQVLNRAPLPFRARVVSQGRVILDRDPNARADFEYRSRYEYFDFRPKRQEYLAEIVR